MNAQTKILLNVVNSTFINPFHAKFPHLYHVYIPPGIHTNFSQTDYYGKFEDKHQTNGWTSHILGRKNFLKTNGEDFT